MSLVEGGLNDGLSPLSDDEVLYRRIPLDFYDRESSNPPYRDSFRPSPRDTNGLSLFRAKHHAPRDIAPSTRKPYWLICVTVASLRAAGLSPVPKPTHVHTGHVEIPELTFANRKDKTSEELQLKLVESLWQEILGPFDPCAA